MTAAPELSIVLPFRNQADHVERVLGAYPPALEAAGIPYEIVAVPNGCSDETPAIVARLAAADPRVRMVGNPAGGWGRSVRMGLAAASGATLCYTNSARTDPVTVVALLALYRTAGRGVAKATRSARGAPVRELGSWAFNLEARVLFGVTGADVNGTPKILSRELLDRLALREDGDLLDLELLAGAARLREPVAELAVTGFRRHGGVSTTTYLSALRMYAGAIRLRMILQ
ncbi:MAG: glycosyltransferase [Candidatus Coatesbacteria bacterium]